MTMRRASRVGITMALLLGAATIALTPTTAGACSFMGPHLEVVGSPSAGGTLKVKGVGFFTIDGSLGADCSGDYDFVPLAPVTVVISFETLSGPRSQAVVAPVEGQAVPSEEAHGGMEQMFSIDVETAIPLDATSVSVEVVGGFAEAGATISGAVATTVPQPAPGPAPAAAPAAAVTGDPNFAG